MFKKYLGIFIALFMLFGITIPSTAIAAGGEQSSSPGVSGQKPLSFTGITLVDGGKNVANATDIPLTPKFKLQFDKNVVNSLFWENNSKCFSMISGSNENIPINVTKVDDTIDFAQRQNIFVQPMNPLQPGTTYRLIISPELKAKNKVAILGGTTNGQGVTIAFKTSGEAVQQAPSATVTSTPQPVTNAGTPTPVPTPTPNTENSSNGKTTSPSTVNPSSTADTNQPSGLSDIQNQGKESAATTPSSVSQSSNEPMKGGGISSENWISIIGAVLIVAWIVVEIIARKKRK